MISERVSSLQNQLKSYIESCHYGERPPELYEPIRYIMSLGGKRLRPLLSLLAYQAFAEESKPLPEEALQLATAIEVFHNFTLMHDDIMDEAPLRRGKKTVHEKWNANTAILSGDVMLVKAYEQLIGINDQQLKPILSNFNRCAAEVCEGQQLDMNFENIPAVSEQEYLEMIRLKTAVLLGFSLYSGAFLAGASEDNCEKVRQFGELVGVGFQLKDDLLDVFGQQEKFGKQVGGDIVANKKTYLLIKAQELAQGEDAELLKEWLSKKSFNKEAKVAAVQGLYKKLGVDSLAEKQVNELFAKAFQNLQEINLPDARKQDLFAFAQYLLHRDL